MGLTDLRERDLRAPGLHRTDQDEAMPIPFACDMIAIPAEQRAAHHALIQHPMSEAVEEIRELPDGLVFRFQPPVPDGAP
jgi:hypothetical protein